MASGSSMGSAPQEADAGFFILQWNGFHVDGYCCWIGGSGAVADALAESVQEHGGKIRLNPLARRVVIEDGRARQARTDDGACCNARHVVSDIDTPRLISKPIGEENIPQWYLDLLQAGGEPSLSHHAASRKPWPHSGNWVSPPRNCSRRTRNRTTTTCVDPLH
jgi:phytoene dehydrogenase-like protein